MDPVWQMPVGVFTALVLVSVVLLAASVVAIIVVLVREIRRNQVW